MIPVLTKLFAETCAQFVEKQCPAMKRQGNYVLEIACCCELNFKARPRVSTSKISKVQVTIINP